MSKGSSPERLSYSPVLTGHLARMEDDIELALANKHILVSDKDIVSDMAKETALELLQEGTIQSLSEFEACLRGIGSRVYCIAVPASHYADYSSVVNPADPATPPKYALVIADSKYDAAGVLQQWEMDAAENASRLPETGIPQD